MLWQSEEGDTERSPAPFTGGAVHGDLSGGNLTPRLLPVWAAGGSPADMDFLLNVCRRLEQSVLQGKICESRGSSTGH